MAVIREVAGQSTDRSTDQPAFLGAGSFYGAVQAKQERCGAIFTELLHSSPRKLPSHSHELPFFGLVLEGQYQERFGRQQIQFSPFNIMFRPAGVPHQDEIGPRGVKLFEIEVRSSLSRCLEDCSASLDRGSEDCSGGSLVWLSLKLHRRLQDGIADELEIESLLSEMLAGVATISSIYRKERPAWLERIVDKLTAEFTERLTLEQLSREAGVHRAHLSRAFRKWKGTGIGEYVHRLRIRAACEHLLAPEIPIAEIGLASGFADQSHFTRSFRRVTGMTPAAFRYQLIGPGSDS